VAGAGVCRSAVGLTIANWKATIMLLLLSLYPATPCRALDPTKQIDQYGHETCTAQNGLPGEAVYQILQGREGYLWLRTALFAGRRASAVRFAPCANQTAEVLRAPIKTIGALRMTGERYVVIQTSAPLACHPEVRAVCGPKDLSSSFCTLRQPNCRGPSRPDKNHRGAQDDRQPLRCHPEVRAHSPLSS